MVPTVVLFFISVILLSSRVSAQSRLPFSSGPQEGSISADGGGNILYNLTAMALVQDGVRSSPAAPPVGLSACDVNPSATIPNMVASSGYRATSCRNAGAPGALVVQSAVHNPNLAVFSIYHGMGSVQCGSDFNPSNFPSGTWTSANSFESGTTTTTSWLFLSTTCTSNVACCVK